MEDTRWMGAALALAARGRGQTAPNPNVGCVIVANGKVVGRGWTQPGGRPHAEAMALAEAGEAARGATAYVTLEPCAHPSPRGPTCADLLIAAGLARVAVALRDPDERTNGAGLARLAAAGIEIIEDVSAAEARSVMAGFLKRVEAGRPHITLKLALSIDGRIAMADGSSRWITGPEARAHAHLERARCELIVVGGATLRSDRPTLNVRLAGLEKHSPRRAVLTRGVPPENWIALGEPREIAGINDVDHALVEGGGGAAAAFLRADLVDRLLVYRAPILIGRGRDAVDDLDLASLDQAHGQWRLADERTLGSDRLEVYERARRN